MSAARLALDPTYRRLPGAGWTPNGPVQYWLARDHLLLVEVVWFKERYRRFDLKDLEALTLGQTRWRWWGSLALLAPVLFATMLTSWFWTSDGAELNEFQKNVFGGLLLLVTLMLVGLLVRFFWRGPTSRVRLKTSVQELSLPGLKRLRAAREFRDQILAAAQILAQENPAVVP